jgi:methionyl-tRNA synthetase
MLDQLNALNLVQTLTPATLQWGVLPADHQVNDPAPVFPRILSEEEKAKLAAKKK